MNNQQAEQFVLMINIKLKDHINFMCLKGLNGNVICLATILREMMELFTSQEKVVNQIVLCVG